MVRARCRCHSASDLSAYWRAVYADGRVCISILHKPGGTADLPDDTPASECWRPILNIEAIVVSVLSMLSDPNFDSPANLDASVRETTLSAIVAKLA
jgi:ubiquitin-protein ligase